MNKWNELPIQIEGNWGASQAADVQAVLKSCLLAVTTRLALNDNLAPSSLRVIGEPERGYPMIWARDTEDQSATTILCSIDHQWAQLAYQFGHELGHIICNSSRAPAAKIEGPSHWLEEALVEAFSVNNLVWMAEDWAAKPPYPNWASYSPNLSNYAKERIDQCRATEHANLFECKPSLWFESQAEHLNNATTLTVNILPIVPWLVDEFSSDRELLSNLVALNTWPERGRCSLSDYIDKWRTSCLEMRIADALPNMIGNKLGLTIY